MRLSAELAAPFRFGTAYLHSELPRVWSRNYLAADTDLDEASAALLAAESDRILGGAGLRHGKVEVYDEEAGARLDPGVSRARLGGALRRAHGRAPGTRSPRRSLAGRGGRRSTSSSRSGPKTRGAALRHRRGDRPATRRQQANRRRNETDARFFAARVDGAIASYCDLYSDGNTGQIEAVVTSEQFRNRGLARATVSRALRCVPRSRKRPDVPHGSAGRLAEGALPEARLRRDRPDLRVRAAGSQLVAIRSTPPFEGWVGRSPVRSQFEVMRRSTNRHVIPALALGSVLATLPSLTINAFGQRHAHFTGQAHFSGVGLTALAAALAAIALTVVGARRRDGRTVLVGTAFSAMAALLALHGLATPGFLVGMNGVVGLHGRRDPSRRRRRARTVGASITFAGRGASDR